MIIVIWSGGPETPSVFTTLDEEKAKSTYFNWRGDSNPDYDQVNVLRVAPDGMILRGRLEWVSVQDWLE